MLVEAGTTEIQPFICISRSYVVQIVFLSKSLFSVARKMVSSVVSSGVYRWIAFGGCSDQKLYWEDVPSDISYGHGKPRFI
jgi:hypothetical protein